MKIKVNTGNLINLVSNLLIRLRTEEIVGKGDLHSDLIRFVEYLEKFTCEKDEVLFDKNFITSKEEQVKLNQVIYPKMQEIIDFKNLLSSTTTNSKSIEKNTSLIKEHLRKIAAALISLKNKSNY